MLKLPLQSYIKHMYFCHLHKDPEGREELLQYPKCNASLFPTNINVSNILHYIQDFRKHMNKSIRQPNQIFLYRQLEDMTQEHLLLACYCKGGHH